METEANVLVFVLCRELWWIWRMKQINEHTTIHLLDGVYFYFNSLTCFFFIRVCIFRKGFWCPSLSLFLTARPIFIFLFFAYFFSLCFSWFTFDYALYRFWNVCSLETKIITNNINIWTINLTHEWEFWFQNFFLPKQGYESLLKNCPPKLVWGLASWSLTLSIILPLWQKYGKICQINSNKTDVLLDNWKMILCHKK